MTWVDGGVLAVLAVSALLAFLRGLVQEVLGVGAWIGAAMAAIAARPAVAPYLEGTIDPPWLADALGVFGVFVVVLILLKLVVGVVGGLVQNSVLGGTDRALGLVFGVARGALLVVVAYILGGMLEPATDRWPEPVRDARSLPLVVEGATWLVAQLPPWLVADLPPEIRPRVATPPARPGPTQDELMRPPARNRT